MDLLSVYPKEEYYFEQTNFEKRLIEEFKERGEEICNNNQDDNENEQVDCDDSQCGGKICGKGTAIVEGGNGTITETEVDFYCIFGTQHYTVNTRIQSSTSIPGVSMLSCV